MWYNQQLVYLCSVVTISLITIGWLYKSHQNVVHYYWKMVTIKLKQIPFLVVLLVWIEPLQSLLAVPVSVRDRVRAMFTCYKRQLKWIFHIHTITCIVHIDTNRFDMTHIPYVIYTFKFITALYDLTCVGVQYSIFVSLLCLA